MADADGDNADVVVVDPDAGLSAPPLNDALADPSSPPPIGGFQDLGDRPPSGGDRPESPWDGEGFGDLAHHSASRKLGSFMATTEGTVTRQAAIEFINVQRWAREGCSTFMFVSILWLAFLVFVYRHSHVAVSFEMYREVTGEVNGLLAKASRGIAPTAIFSAAGESMCSCSCPAMCESTATSNVLPGVPPGAFLINGTVLPEQIQTMRAKAQFLRNVNDRYESGEKEKIIQLGDVNSIANVWFWLQHGMVPEFWKEEPRSNPVDTQLLFGDKGMLAAAKGKLAKTETPGYFMRWNQVIGGVRLRQRRLHQADCRADVPIAGDFKQKCHRSLESIVPFGLGTRTYAAGFVPDKKEKGAFDIYLDTDRPVHMSLETIKYMLQANQWLDASTKSLLIQVPIFNAEATPPMFGLLEIDFRFTRSGDLTKTVDLKTASANPYTGFDLYYLPDAVFIGFLVYLLFKKLFQACKYFVKKRDRHDILCNFWFMFDWATLFSGFLGIVGWFYMVQETGSIGVAVAAMPKAPAFDAPEALVTTYHEAWGEILDRISTLTRYREQIRLAGFAYSMILIFQFIKAFRGQPKLAQLTRTLINAVEDLTHFLMMFLVMFLTFAFTGHLVWGLRLEAWSTSTKCVNASFRALRGDVDLQSMYEIAPLTTVVWFWLFLLVNIFVMMNLLLATVYDHYQLVKGKANAFTGILLQAKDAFKDVWHREGCKLFCCRCCCRCRKREGYPSHSEILEELMHRADYGPKERHYVFRTVLGPKWMRKKMEKHVFAGEIAADAIKLKELCIAEDDFKEFMDPDYYEGILEDAQNYREREFDPEEIHVNQMRELVTLCEIEMAHMRDRLDKCQGHLKFSMHTLANRLHHVDVVVHDSLASLYFLANSAGVPTKKENGLVDDVKSVAALKDTYQRIMQHLAQGQVKAKVDEREVHQAHLAELVNARKLNDTYSRIHTNARLAEAFGGQEKLNVARQHRLDKPPPKPPRSPSKKK